MPGVVDVVQIPDGVAVVASSYWAAVKARRALKIEWDNGAGAAVSTASMLKGTMDAAANGKVIAVQPPVGDAKGAIASAAKQISATYVTPLLSHSPLEPMNFTAHVTAGKALLIGGTQFQQGAQGATAAALGIKPEDVDVQTTFLGGGFGRRSNFQSSQTACEIGVVT
jgi:isoquinoline 1-oxidoreductase beta subunit